MVVLSNELVEGTFAFGWENFFIDSFDGVAASGSQTYNVTICGVVWGYNHHLNFLRQWLAKCRGVSKHHLQGYLRFLALLLNDDTNWFSKILSYDSSR